MAAGQTPRKRERGRRSWRRAWPHTLDGRRKAYDDVGDALGVNPNALRYATTTGTVLIRWDGARAPLVWTVPAPQIAAADARSELARRYLHVFGSGTPHGFVKWAGITDRAATAAFETLSAELLTVRTPLGPASALASDEEHLRAQPTLTAAVRLLPSGDAYYLLWGPDRRLLVADASRQAELWTPRVWPGAVLMHGELGGTWRRAQGTVRVHLWGQPTTAQRDAVEAEAAGLPIPGCDGRIRVVWD